MMELRPAPRPIVAAIRILQGSEGAIGVVALACAGSVFAMMAIRVVVAWQTGLL